ncbi:DUF4333 domain-containing protein [Mycobacterium sp. TNTM28]|uniref:DUF4333 domain-containing protein n=1 Tax=[Mycobacterium] fortunisiensis TaxID=2600579 RepID=A0ABS6KTX2_9MYCO|nr:DUF4333 domain-containing protein [[Mycobacterium] fortunisiensis]MBU9767026.1 DUF4333 domain-containing protein [[Mycobacterium] fortunisiensis]
MPGLMVFLGACHVSIGTDAKSSDLSTSPATEEVQAAVPKGDLEQITAQQIREQSGGGPIVIKCPGDLPIKLGANQRCVLSQDGNRFFVTITITKAGSPNDAVWDWEVGEQISGRGVGG